MKQLVANSTPKRIKHIQFSVLSPQEIVALSSFEANQRDLYDPNNRSLPVANGVLDRRLGTSDKQSTCATCGHALADCVGHSAHVRLQLPVFHVGYFKNILQILQCICKTCSRILLEPAEHKKFLAQFRRANLDTLTMAAMSRAVSSQCRKRALCPYCGAINGVVKKHGALRIVHEKYRGRNRTRVPEPPPAGQSSGGNKLPGSAYSAQRAQDKATYDAWRASFREAEREARELAPHVDKALDDINALRALLLFRHVPDHDCELLGLDPDMARPEDLIWQFVPVPPVCIRPSVQQDAATTEDDITVKLTEIIFMNTVIKNNLARGSPAQTLNEQWDYLSLSVAMVINSDMPGLANAANGAAGAGASKPSRGFCQRLKGKQGRFRGNLSGKRVDFSGRTVISPDPNLRIDEVAVPERVAKVLTYPDRVTSHNIAALRQAIVNGTDVHPGANYLVTGTNDMKRFLKFGDRQEIAAKLKLGDVVERHLRDGDIVLFNRQPSLHKLSIMSHRVKVRPWRTFRLNECVCTPYNADFDGDEMNLHVPQTEEARTEALELMNIKHNLVTPRNGEPIIAATQDFITGCYLLTKRDTFLTRDQFTQACSYLADANMHIDIPHPAVLKPAMLWTGKQVFNVLMRPNKHSKVLVNLECKCRTFEKPGAALAAAAAAAKKKGDGVGAALDAAAAAAAKEPNDMSPNDGWLVVQNSEIMCGVMDKSTVGDGNKKSVFGVILRDYGPDEAAAAMNKMAKLCARFLANMGFSIGISDVTPGVKLRADKDRLVEEAYVHSHDLISKAKDGKLENQPGCDQEQTLEAMISGALSGVRNAVGEICMTELSRNNSPLIMATCGSKGSKINVSQMVACVGQQIISGSRVPDGFQDRSLPHFPKGSKDPPSKGFVRNSFYSGLVATEFLFHAISGREGLVDTAVKTAETGYMQRRLMKALEDLSSRYDRSVRNAVGGVVQFIYGDDGLDPINLEADEKPVDFERTWMHARAINLTAPGRGLMPFEVTDFVEQATATARYVNACSEEHIKAIRDFVATRIVEPAAKFRAAYGMGAAKKGDADASSDFTAVEKAVVDNKTRVTERQLASFLQMCWEKFVRAKVEPGTAVGAIGAQSIGEPGTQMTLKTFHFAGVASMNVTLGVPRIKEIINAAKTISTPIISATLAKDDDESAARVVKARVEKTFLSDISSSIASTFGETYVHVSIHIDMDAVSRLQLEVTLDSIRQAILMAPKLKIKPTEVYLVKHRNHLRVAIEIGEDGAGYRRLMALRRALPHVAVKGIPGLHRAVIQEEVEGVARKKKLLVEGVGLREVMTTDGVVGVKTTSNHIMEVESVLGIEAARASIIKEIHYTMSSHGLGVDARHIMLLGDIMTNKGEVLGITRFGIAKMKDSVIALSSFEKTTDHLFQAAFNAKKDSMQGVSECIIVGKPANNIGSAMPALVASKPALHPHADLLFEREGHFIG